MYIIGHSVFVVVVVFNSVHSKNFNDPTRGGFVVVVFNSVQLKNKTKQKTNFIPQGAILLLLLLLFLLSFVCLFVFVCFTCDLFVHLFPAEPLAHD